MSATWEFVVDVRLIIDYTNQRRGQKLIPDAELASPFGCTGTTLGVSNIVEGRIIFPSLVTTTNWRCCYLGSQSVSGGSCASNLESLATTGNIYT
jgi:hypothetical protein